MSVNRTHGPPITATLTMMAGVLVTVCGTFMVLNTYHAAERELDLPGWIGMAIILVSGSGVTSLAIEGVLERYYAKCRRKDEEAIAAQNNQEEE